MAFKKPTFWQQVASHFVRAALGAVLLVAPLAKTCFGQAVPPLDVTLAGPLLADPNAQTLGAWTLYPTLRLSSSYSNNLFQSPVGPISAAFFGVSPSLTAEWTDGIHKTNLYGTFDSETFPTQNVLNEFNRQAGFIQSYSPLPDLTFRLQGDYTHQTFSSPLLSGIPTAPTAPTTQLLPNGNTLLPNGQIISPTGQVVGQSIPALSTGSATNVVNPFDVFTATASAEKIFNRGIIQFTSSIARTDYESNQITPNVSATTFSGHGAVWATPLFYVYSDGTATNLFDLSGVTSGPSPANSSAYRALAGIGSGQPEDFFHESVYYGQQGSEQGGSGSAGGEIYGGTISYDPTQAWTISARVDETVNIAASQTANSNVALTLPTPVPLLIAESTSTRTTSSLLQSRYRFSAEWAISASFGYSRIDYLDSIRLDNALLADAYVSYDIWRNLTLTWEYQYSEVTSNIPFVSSYRNFISMGALYKF
jgi:hypothetical protein